MNTNAIKIYVRLDAKGNIIPGTAVRRKKKPKIGRWKEISATLNVCCEEQG